MRIIAGTARGRTLKSPPPGSATRPTTDQVREAVFNILGPNVRGTTMLDLFAGTGSVGLEALSRGAARVVFLEADSAMARVLRSNVELLGFTPTSRVLQRELRRAGSLLEENGPFHLVFIDPPWGHGLELLALDLLAKHPCLAPDGTIIVEHSTRATPELSPLPAGFECTDLRRYGDTSLTFLQAPAAHSPVRE